MENNKLEKVNIVIFALHAGQVTPNQNIYDARYFLFSIFNAHVIYQISLAMFSWIWHRWIFIWVIKTGVPKPLLCRVLSSWMPFPGNRIFPRKIWEISFISRIFPSNGTIKSSLVPIPLIWKLPLSLFLSRLVLSRLKHVWECRPLLLWGSQVLPKHWLNAAWKIKFTCSLILQIRWAFIQFYVKKVGKHWNKTFHFSLNVSKNKKIWDSRKNYL